MSRELYDDIEPDLVTTRRFISTMDDLATNGLSQAQEYPALLIGVTQALAELERRVRTLESRE